MRSPTRSIRSLCAALVLGGILGPAAAPYAQERQTDVDPVFGSPGLGLESSVAALAVQPDGKLLVAAGIRHLVRLNTDGTLDTSFRPRIDGIVNAMAVQRDGGIIIAGAFQHVDGDSAAGGLARLYTNGKLDKSFDSSGDSDFYLGSRALTIALQRDGKILIGGFAENEFSVITSGIARLNHDGNLDTSFNAGIDQVAGYPQKPNCVYAVQVQTDGQILIGGIFTQVDSVARSGFARLKKDGSLDSAYKPAVRGTITPGALQADDKLLVTGSSNRNGAGTIRTLVRLNKNGSVDGTFNDNGGTFSSSFDYDANSPTGLVAEQANGQILVAAPYALSRLNPDGSADADFQAAADGGFTRVLPQADGSLFLGGTFTEVNGVKCNSIARLQADGSPDQSYLVDVSSGPNGTVYSMAVQADGSVVIGGTFTELDGVACQCLAALTSDGTPD